MVKCTCGSEETYYDSARGEQACGSCGRVLEEHAIVAEVAFNNSTVVGRFGNQSGDYTQIKQLMGNTRNSKEIRLQKVYKRIQQLANNLHLEKDVADSARRIFNSAHHYGFTQGRHTSHVIAAAMYIACRREKTPHLLIDFSDELQINLYILGACYIKLVKLLHLEVPLIDPSLFIHRFCAKLEFGEKTKDVTITALRLVQRMERDWMSYGRRPNSLCGAAILIAARYHGFKRTTTQIVQTVHVCDETIRKRLEEFKRTTVANLTREEFEQIDLEKDIEKELDPPSFKKALENNQPLPITNEDEEELQRTALHIEKEMKEGMSQSPSNEIFMSKSISQENATNNMELENALEIVSSKSQSLMPLWKNNSVPQTSNYFEEHQNKESLSDEEGDISELLLTNVETKVKTLLWNQMNKDWIEKQKLKWESQGEKKGSIQKRKKKTREVFNAPDALTAVTECSKLKGRLNSDAVRTLFDPDITIKKVKKE